MKGRLRIMARVHAMPPDHNAGAEHMLVAMLQALVERGHDVEVWLSRRGTATEVYEYGGVRVIPSAARLDFPSQVRHADVLVSHLECVPTAAALARGFGKPMIVVCHNDHKPTLRDIASGATALAVYNSEWMSASAGVFFAEFPPAFQPSRTLVVRPPVHAKRYAVKAGRAATLVNCNEDKGGLLLADLAKRMPDQPFLAVEGAYGEQILPDLPNVQVLRHIPGDEMAAKVYQHTKVLLMPSLYESWGRVGVEAMASGIPVIAHPTSGLCESLGDAGIFIDRKDPDAWQAALERLLTDPAEYRLASKRARARSTELDPSEDLAAWCTAVEEVAGARATSR